MSFNKSFASIIFIAIITLNGCSKKENTTELPRTKSESVQVASPITPPVIGEFVELNKVNNVCSLKILDGNKKEIDLHASFDICNGSQILKGSIYKFTYKIFEVPDCDCESNTECMNKCTKKRKEELIDSAELVASKATNDKKTINLEKNIEDQKSIQAKNKPFLNGINDDREFSSDQRLNLNNISKELSEKLSIPLNKIKFSLLVDVNGDEIKDFFIEINDSSYCGSGGCQHYAYVSRNKNEFIEFDLKNFYKIRLSKNNNGQLPILFVDVHGSACKKSGFEPCFGELKWNGREIIIANYKSD